MVTPDFDTLVKPDPVQRVEEGYINTFLLILCVRSDTRATIAAPPPLRRAPGVHFRSYGPFGRILSASGGDQNIRFVMCHHNGGVCFGCEASFLSRFCMFARPKFLESDLVMKALLFFMAVQVISPFHIYYNYRLIVQRRELWRLVSNFFYFGNFGKPFGYVPFPITVATVTASYDYKQLQTVP